MEQDDIIYSKQQPLTSSNTIQNNNNNNVQDDINNQKLPAYITKDNPKPAIFIARKLFSDFVQLADKKIEAILASDPKDKPLYKSLQQDEDPQYDQILEALGSISEFCLPSLLKITLAWYHHQLGVDDACRRGGGGGANSSLLLESCQSQTTQPNQQATNNCDHHSHLFQNSLDRASPCGGEANDTTTSIASTIRSPTPSSPDTSNQISILSTLPLDYQSPTSLTVISTTGGGGGSSGNDPGHSSAANTSTSTATNVSSNSLTEDSLTKTRKLLIEFTFCQLLIKIFNQLHLHPGHQDLINQIEDIAFEHFRYQEGNDTAINQIAADKYAEVIGVLAQTRFKSVKKRFMAELNELRSIKEPTPNNIQCIVTLLSGIKFFRVKMAPIEELEASLQFLQECADYFLEVRHKSIRHALACLFVEILVPLASIVKNEVKIPCLKNFVETLWAQTLDMCSRKKHSITLFPLVTCLLCVSQKTFFLANWVVFLNMCLANLKNRDQKMCRIALESLYRLIWIYIVRVKCESNVATQARLANIVDALFPKGGRSVVPRDAPLGIFVDIINFVAQERLDFAMRHIIFDLLSVDRSFKIITAPERMNIALQAFLVIADSLQHKDGDPPLPVVVGTLSSSTLSHSDSNRNLSNAAVGGGGGGGFRRLNNGNNKMLTDDIAKTIGLHPYYSHVQRSLNDILKALDNQFGRPLLLTVSTNNKEFDEIIKGERKPKIDLFKTCIAAIPRLMPDGMSRQELIELLSRLTVHVNEEMRKAAFETLQTFVTDFPDWRLDAIEGFTQFLATQINESLRGLVENALKMLLQLLISWHQAITPPHQQQQHQQDSASKCGSVTIQTGYETISSRHGGTGGQIAARKNRELAQMRLIQSELAHARFDRLVSVIQKVEGTSLVMLCNCHQPTRRLASHLLRESRSILKCYSTWICMEQLSFKSPDDVEEDDLSASLRGSLSADNLSRITTTSANGGGGLLLQQQQQQQQYSSATSMNNNANSINLVGAAGGPNHLLSASASKMCMVEAANNNAAAHDPYDSDVEQTLADCFSGCEENSVMIFWLSVITLESDNEQEYAFALRLLKKFLPNLPFEQPKFLEQLEKNLEQMEWTKFPGLHALVLKGCTSSSNYDISIALLDHLTPILLEPICCGQSHHHHGSGNQIFPTHVIVLLTRLLAEYDHPTAASMNIARRIAIWCDESSQKLENLSAVMTLYSRRCFSKDGFQWTKCVIKYLHDAYPNCFHQIIPLLVDLIERGPAQMQRLVPPILYCILNYLDLSSAPAGPAALNKELERLYANLLGAGPQAWRDAIHLFKLIIARSSTLAIGGLGSGGGSGTSQRGELPGRTMDFTLDVELLPVIARAEQQQQQQHQQQLMLQPPPPPTSASDVPAPMSPEPLQSLQSLQSPHQSHPPGASPEQQQQATSGGELLEPNNHLLVDTETTTTTELAEVNDGAGEATLAGANVSSGGGGEPLAPPPSEPPKSLQQELPTAPAPNGSQQLLLLEHQVKWRRSWLAHGHVRQRLVSLLKSTTTTSSSSA